MGSRIQPGFHCGEGYRKPEWGKDQPDLRSTCGDGRQGGAAVAEH